MLAATTIENSFMESELAANFCYTYKGEVQSQMRLMLNLQTRVENCKPAWPYKNLEECFLDWTCISYKWCIYTYIVFTRCYIMREVLQVCTTLASFYKYVEEGICDLDLGLLVISLVLKHPKQNMNFIFLTPNIQFTNLGSAN